MWWLIILSNILIVSGFYVFESAPMMVIGAFLGTGVVVKHVISWDIWYGKGKVGDDSASQTSIVADAKFYTRDDNPANIEFDKLKQQVNALERKLVDKEKELEKEDENEGKVFSGFMGKILTFFMYIILGIFVLAILIGMFGT